MRLYHCGRFQEHRSLCSTACCEPWRRTIISSQCTLRRESRASAVRFESGELQMNPARSAWPGKEGRGNTGVIEGDTRQADRQAGLRWAPLAKGLGIAMVACLHGSNNSTGSPSERGALGCSAWKGMLQAPALQPAGPSTRHLKTLEPVQRTYHHHVQNRPGAGPATGLPPPQTAAAAKGTFQTWVTNAQDG